MDVKAKTNEWEIVKLSPSAGPHPINHPFSQYRLWLQIRNSGEAVAMSMNFTSVLYLFVYFNVCKVEDLVGKCFEAPKEFCTGFTACNYLIGELQKNIHRKE